MNEVVTVHAAKTHLSQLLARVEAAEEIIIARGKTPVASRSGTRSSRGACPARIAIRSIAC